MKTKTISHSQYESLRSYPTEPTQTTVWRADGFDKRLINAGLLVNVGGGYRVSTTGLAALAAYRHRYGLPAEF